MLAFFTLNLFFLLLKRGSVNRRDIASVRCARLVGMPVLRKALLEASEWKGTCIHRAAQGMSSTGEWCVYVIGWVRESVFAKADWWSAAARVCWHSLLLSGIVARALIETLHLLKHVALCKTTETRWWLSVALILLPTPFQDMAVSHAGYSPKDNNFFHAFHIRICSWLFLKLGMGHAPLNSSQYFSQLMKQHMANQHSICSVTRNEFCVVRNTKCPGVTWLRSEVIRLCVRSHTHFHTHFSNWCKNVG